MRVEISDVAELDLEEIGDYIAVDNPVRALSFIAELRAACHRIGDEPLAAPLQAELGQGIRSRSHGRYLILFKSETDVVIVARVLHSARNIPSLIAASPSPDC